MELKEELRTYEDHLVGALLDQPDRRLTEAPGSFQVFIGNQSLGQVECESDANAEKTFSEIPTQGLIELRSASGLLLGSISSAPQRHQTTQFQAGHFLLTLELQTQEETGQLHVSAQNLLSVPRRGGVDPSTLTATDSAKPEINIWWKLALAAQFLLVTGVVFLVGERVYQNSPIANTSQQSVDSQDQQIQKILHQLADLQRTLESKSVLTAKNSSNIPQTESGESFIVEKNSDESIRDSLLTKKPETLQPGILQHRPVWVRFKKDISDSRIQEILKEVSAEQYSQMGNWHSISLNLSDPQAPGSTLKPWQEKGDIEIISTSTVTRKVQVRFRKGIPDNQVNAFFEEVHVKRSKPNDSWYDLDLALPESVEPKDFIGELRSGKVIEGINVDMNHLPSR